MKTDIILRLFREGHITVEEMIILAQDSVVVNNVAAPTVGFPVQTWPSIGPVFTQSNSSVS
jgi:hypothetical protein